MLETIYICRHGCRQDWIDPEAGSSVTGLYHDPSLSQHGLDQAEHLAEFLSSPPEQSPVPDLIFSSPFYRCIQTSLPLSRRLKKPLHLELGVMEWFAPPRQGTGLHTRPGPVSAVQPHFPPDSLHPTYTSTYYPSRHGESVEELWSRINQFLHAFIRRVDTEWPEAKAIVLYAHAATVIKLGQALVGDHTYPVKAGTTSCSMYVRKSKDGQHKQTPPLGGWEQVWNGRTDYLPDGEERHWDFSQVIFTADGQVLEDVGDGLPIVPDGHLPVGLAADMEKYLI